MININKNTPPELLVATTNKGKQREFAALLSPYPVICRTPGELHINLEVEETGATYAENALLKAQAYCLASGMVVLADDTGLEVDTLDGAPGLHSARFSFIPGATDADRRAKLLTLLKDRPKPWTAAFQCVVALALPGEPVNLFEGTVSGEIIEEERGEHGFGYDRIFYIPDAGKTMAELDLEEKNSFSHRALAVKKAIPILLQRLNLG